MSALFLVSCSSDQESKQRVIDRDRQGSAEEFMKFHDEIFQSLDVDRYRNIVTDDFVLVFRDADGKVNNYDVDFVVTLLNFAKTLEKRDTYRRHPEFQYVSPAKIIFSSIVVSTITNEGEEKRTVSKETYTLVKMNGFFFVSRIESCEKVTRNSC